MSVSVRELLQHAVSTFSLPENQGRSILPVYTINLNLIKTFGKSLSKKNISDEGREFGLTWEKDNCIKCNATRCESSNASQVPDALRSLQKAVDIYKGNMKDHMPLADINSLLKLMSIHPPLDESIVKDEGGLLGFSLVDDNLFWKATGTTDNNSLTRKVPSVVSPAPATSTIKVSKTQPVQYLYADKSLTEIVELSRTLKNTGKDMSRLLIALFQSRKLFKMNVNAIRVEFQNLGKHAKKFAVTKKMIDKEGINSNLHWETSGSATYVVWRPKASLAPTTAAAPTRSAVTINAPAKTKQHSAAKVGHDSQVSSVVRVENVSTFVESNSAHRAAPLISHASNSMYSYFYGSRELLGEGSAAGNVILDETGYRSPEVKGGYFGNILHVGAEHGSKAFLNVVEPFSLVCVGRQGTGKSHTLNVVLENCIVNFSEPVELPITRMTTQMCGLVLHFDQSDSNVCEALGLHDMAPSLKTLSERSFHGAKKVIVLVSPNYHLQRRNFYKDMPHVTVRTLRFQWSSLDAAQLKKLMRLDSSDSQLYVSLMLSMLGDYQARNQLPDMDEFFSDFQKKCSPEQQRPLLQRLNLLHSMVTQNRNDDMYAELSSLMEPGTFIVCDLTDPMLSEVEVNAVFQVLLQQFRRHPLRDCGKVVVFDEAHKYLSTDTKSDCLSKDIVSTIRQMRHENIRVLLSTQSPLHLPSEAIELSTVVVMHEFQSKDWYKYVESKLSLPTGGFETVKNLRRGDALLCSNKIMQSLLPASLTIHQEEEPKQRPSESIVIQVRERITTDCGRSMTH
jgi:hypothetical protein